VDQQVSILLAGLAIDPAISRFRRKPRRICDRRLAADERVCSKSIEDVQWAGHAVRAPVI
jgi:hypothetical protein